MTTGRINQVTILCPDAPACSAYAAGTSLPPCGGAVAHRLVRRETTPGLYGPQRPHVLLVAGGERASQKAPVRESQFSGPHHSPPHLDSLRRGTRLSRFQSNDRLVSPPECAPWPGPPRGRHACPRCIRGVNDGGRPHPDPARSQPETSASRRSLPR